MEACVRMSFRRYWRNRGLKERKRYFLQKNHRPIGSKTEEVPGMPIALQSLIDFRLKACGITKMKLLANTSSRYNNHSDVILIICSISDVHINVRSGSYLVIISARTLIPTVSTWCNRDQISDFCALVRSPFLTGPRDLLDQIHFDAHARPHLGLVKEIFAFVSNLLFYHPRLYPE